MKGISYIITTYNRSHLLERAIQSIIAERILPSELIIIDDCSTETFSISSKIKETFGEDIHLIRNTQNLGVIRARNVGIMAAKYDFLLFLDDDDQSFSNRSKDLWAYIAESDYAFVAAKCEMHTFSFMKVVPNTAKRELDTKTLLQFPASINAIIWRKSALLSLQGMDNRVPYFGEHITMHSLLLQGQKALQVAEVVAHFTYLENGLTQDVTKNNIMKERLILFYETLAVESQNTSSYHYFAKLSSLLPTQNIITFDDYLAFVDLALNKGDLFDADTK